MAKPGDGVARRDNVRNVTVGISLGNRLHNAMLGGDEDVVEPAGQQISNCSWLVIFILRRGISPGFGSLPLIIAHPGIGGASMYFPSARRTCRPPLSSLKSRVRVP